MGKKYHEILLIIVTAKAATETANKNYWYFTNYVFCDKQLELA